MRPFDLYSIPPVRYEVKYGEKNSKGYPTKLNYFKVVERIKDGKGRTANYTRCDAVHEALGDDRPTEIPITLMSDSVDENFQLLRGLWHKGNLMCSADYGDTTAMRRFREGEGVVDEPYAVECSAECPYWTKPQGAKFRCDISGTLMFRFNAGPIAGHFGMLRVKGTYSQRYIMASLKMIKAENGILANLPLQLSYHTENKQAQDGRSYPIPLISVQPALGPVDFRSAVYNEIKTRQDIGRENIVSVLDDIRDAHEIVEVGEPVADEEEFEIPSEVEEILKGLPSRRADMLLHQHTNEDGEIDLIALKKAKTAAEKDLNDLDF